MHVHFFCTHTWGIRHHLGTSINHRYIHTQFLFLHAAPGIVRVHRHNKCLQNCERDNLDTMCNLGEFYYAAFWLYYMLHAGQVCISVWRARLVFVPLIGTAHNLQHRYKGATVALRHFCAFPFLGSFGTLETPSVTLTVSPGCPAGYSATWNFCSIAWCHLDCHKFPMLRDLGRKPYGCFP